MKNHKIGQERALGVIVADLSKKCIFLRGLAPTPKSKVLSDLDPIWPPSAPNPGGGDDRDGEFQAIEMKLNTACHTIALMARPVP